MWITAGSLHLIFAVFLYCIDSISSEPRTLNDLFHGYSDVIPRVETLVYNGQFPNIETFRDKHLNISISNELLKRDHIIFAFYQDGKMEDLCRLYNLANVSIAFDTSENKWLTLHPDLARELGVGRDYELVVARDEVAFRHFTRSMDPSYKRAHIRACKKANDHVNVVERQQENLLLLNRTTIQDSIRAIQNEYSRAYDREFGLYLFERGLYGVHGYKAGY